MKLEKYFEYCIYKTIIPLERHINRLRYDHFLDDDHYITALSICYNLNEHLKLHPDIQNIILDTDDSKIEMLYELYKPRNFIKYIAQKVGLPTIDYILKFFFISLTLPQEYYNLIPFKVITESTDISKNDTLISFIQTKTSLLPICRITFIYNNNKICIDGYFKDIIKLHKLESHIFYDKYTYYAHRIEHLIYSMEEWKQYVEEQNKLFQRLIKLNYEKLVLECYNDIHKLYYAIRVLMVGNDEHIKLAVALFKKLRGKKINNYLISEKILDCMPFKLKKILLQASKVKPNITLSNVNPLEVLRSCVHVKNIPINIKTLIMERLNDKNNGENHKQLVYVKTLINYPWNEIYDEVNNKSELLNDVSNKLKQLTYGHDKIKNKLILQVAKWLSNPQTTGCSIGLCGPPGVGKTLLVKSLSEALGIPFIQLTLGGQNDGSLLHGHSYTYTCAQPGIIVKKIAEAGTSRCILFLDELDKCAKKHGDINEITSILIHLTDPNSNHAFQDRFFDGVDFPLERLIIVASYNNRKKIDPILLDRFNEINVEPYTIKDKINISKNFIIPELSKNIGLNHDIEIKDEDIKYIIKQYTNEGGVRNLKRRIEDIMLKINKEIVMGTEYDKNIKLSREEIINLIDDKCFNEQEKIHDKDEVGIINGLYATNNGNGGILPIQVNTNYLHDGKKGACFRLTGSQGTVMKESVECAFTCAMRYLSTQIDVPRTLREQFSYGFHVHTPSTSTPKDGPSAGCAFALAFISRLLNHPIKRTIGITGEIDLNGNITKIGGLVYKIIGAKSAGITHILISKENQIDMEDILIKHNELFDEDFKYTFVATLDEAVKLALINK
uniref:Lon proteolytic domain-containing protein n=1 Tax=viral metagenome TaxID=1070528 RepID=A0A6C0M1H7_9ZZZZ